MLKLTYKLTVLSSIILSPRMSAEMYVEKSKLKSYESDKNKTIAATSENESGKEKSKLAILYPFYQYGLYDEYNPDKAAYYIPGSSIKGALLQGEKENSNIRRNFMVDDIVIPREPIDIPKEKIWAVNLYKTQYIKSKKNDKNINNNTKKNTEQKEEPVKAKFELFFPNVYVEMLRAGTVLEGNLYAEDKNINMAEKIFSDANSKTKDKLTQTLKYLERLLNTPSGDEKFFSTLKKVIKKLNDIKTTDNILLLGGYKGLLDSAVLNQKTIDDENFSSGIFIDQETILPHGLMQFDLEQ